MPAPSFCLPLLSYPDPTPVEPLARALDLAATLGGSVHAVIHEADIPPIVNPLSGVLLDVAGLIAAAETHSREVSAALANNLGHQAERMALTLDVTHVRGNPQLAGDVLAQAARTFDFSLLLPEADDGWHASVTEAVLFGSGGPAFLFPAHDAPVHLNCVAVAWDGSRAASRAVRDAIPVLQVSRRVVLLTAAEDKPAGKETLGAIRRLMDGHAIPSESIDVAGADRPVGEALQQAALDQGAGLLVMGAYGHGRMREFMLGGATRKALRQQRLPLLMSH